MSLRTRLALVGGSFLLAGLFGCSTLADLGIAVPYLGDPPVTTIDRLPEKPKGALVYLRGVVGEQAPFLNGGAYLLKDGSGAIWIRTTTSRMPKKGSEIVVKGNIDFENVPKGFQIGNEVYIRELEQLDARAIAPAPSAASERQPEPQPSPVVERQPEPQPSPVAERQPEPQPSPVAEREADETTASVHRSGVEVIPPKPPAEAKPVVDPLDAFFFPHKQGRK